MEAGEDKTALILASRALGPFKVAAGTKKSSQFNHAGWGHFT